MQYTLEFPLPRTAFQRLRYFEVRLRRQSLVQSPNDPPLRLSLRLILANRRAIEGVPT